MLIFRYRIMPTLSVKFIVTSSLEEFVQEDDWGRVGPPRTKFIVMVVSARGDIPTIPLGVVIHISQFVKRRETFEL
jgi:hypothetical protein